MTNILRPYTQDQPLLLPLDLREWLPEGDLALFVACTLTQEATDVGQFLPLVSQIEISTGQRPAAVLADAGYFSDTNVTAPALTGIAVYVSLDRSPHTPLAPGVAPTRAAKSPAAAAMRERLGTAAGRVAYALRKSIVEPVFGQIKEIRRFRRFALRGVGNVRAEWQLICLTHNLLKLFRSGWTPAARDGPAHSPHPLPSRHASRAEPWPRCRRSSLRHRTGRALLMIASCLFAEITPTGS
jgi:mRNA-degrading endonuclease toxin of MazEF toxin-antitoxin module